MIHRDQILLFICGFIHNNDGIEEKMNYYYCYCYGISVSKGLVNPVLVFDGTDGS